MFSLESVRLLYATRLCIPNVTAAADQMVEDQMVINLFVIANNLYFFLKYARTQKFYFKNLGRMSIISFI